MALWMAPMMGLLGVELDTEDGSSNSLAISIEKGSKDGLKDAFIDGIKDGSNDCPSLDITLGIDKSSIHGW
jgi:hypothetical protein